MVTSEEEAMDENETLDEYLFRPHLRSELDRDAANGPAVVPGELTVVHAKDGAALAASVFRARTAAAVARPPVVIASATGVRRAFYAGFASFLASRGHDVITFDYRGIGDSRRAARKPKMHDWGEKDLAGVVEHASVTLGARRGKVDVIGHSVGGQIVGLLPPAEIESVRRFVSVAAQSGDYRLWPLPSRLAMAALWYGVVPGVTRAVGYLPGSLGIGEDLPPGVALEWAAWCRTPGYLVGGPGAPRKAGFARLRAETLAFGFEDDPYAPPAAITALLELYENASVERVHVSRAEVGPVGHFGFFRDRFRKGLWDHAERFLAR
jgi:predicted alpha/beta hydrolase